MGLTVSIVLKSYKSNLTDHVSTITALCILIASVVASLPIIQYVRELSREIEGGEEMITLMLKAFSILLVTRTVSEICLQNGEKMLSDVLEYASTISIVLLILPMIKEILSDALKLIKV